ncbi:MarR family winged helix-turn-helix transcriptional regulator [Actinomycetes bacterium KLBMP 9759]
MTTDGDAGPALFRLVRFWSRRWMNQASTGLTGDMRNVQHIQTIEAVAAAGPDATVADVAHQLGLDHSGASRMVRDATLAGHLARATAEHDRRRASLQLTDAGQKLLSASHQWQRDTFEQLTANWTAEDRERFGTYLTRIADEIDPS